MYSGWESGFLEEMEPRFEKEAGSGYGAGEDFEDLNLDYFAKRSGNDIIENGNTVSSSCVHVQYGGTRRSSS